MNKATYQAAVEALSRAADDTKDGSLLGGTPKWERIVQVVAPILEAPLLEQAERLALALDQVLALFPRDPRSATFQNARGELDRYRASR